MNFTKYFKFYNIFSCLLLFSAIFLLFAIGLNFSIDFTGGSILEIEFEKRPENPVIQEKLRDLNLGEITIQPTGDRGVILRIKEINEASHQEILSKLGEISNVREQRFENIGPVVGKELRQKTITLIIVSLLSLLIYITIAFSKVSRPISSWQYGVISILTLSFDVLVAIGIFTLLEKFYQVQLSVPIVTALLTILGYTINDKVIVFDRIRENILKGQKKTFEETVNFSLNQTLTRSLSTGTCTLLVLLFIFFFGGDTLRYFSLILIVGIVVGTYSSLFLATPILVGWLKWQKKRH